MGFAHCRVALRRARRTKSLAPNIVALSLVIGEGRLPLQSEYDPDVLFVLSSTAAIIVVLFVDDIWIFAQRFSDAGKLLTLLRSRFWCTEPEYLCGNEEGRSL